MKRSPSKSIAVCRHFSWQSSRFLFINFYSLLFVFYFLVYSILFHATVPRVVRLVLACTTFPPPPFLPFLPVPPRPYVNRPARDRCERVYNGTCACRVTVMPYRPDDPLFLFLPLDCRPLLLLLHRAAYCTFVLIFSFNSNTHTPATHAPPPPPPPPVGSSSRSAHSNKVK